MFELRWYQKEAVNTVFAYKGYKENRNPLLALPTGSGKSPIQATIAKQTLERWGDQRILMLTHQRELIQQNEETLLKLWPEAPVGVFSAGLGRKEFAKILFAGIQSIYRHPELFAHYNLIMVDEAHLIGYRNGSMYRKFFNAVQRPIIGFTATPFRLGTGLLTEGTGKEDPLFHDIIYDLSQGPAFTRLIDEGFLCPLVTKKTTTEIDVSEARVRAGEFISEDLEKATDQEEITNAALDEVVRQGQDRKHWLIFAISIEHAKHISTRLDHLGISNAVVHSKLNLQERDNILDCFKKGEIRAVTNINILSVGFDHRAIDLIVLLRPTCSPVFHVQSIGRGLRIAPGKKDALVLDFAGNTQRLGPVNQIQLRKIRKGSGNGKPITKVCPECQSIVHAATRLCDCGYEFEFETKLERMASDQSIVHRVEVKPPVWMKVNKMMAYRHQKIGKPDSLRVVYRSGLRSFTEWICFEHKGQARYKAELWWRQRTLMPVPDSITEALLLLSELKIPTEIQVHEQAHSRFTTITGYRFGSEESAAGIDKRLADSRDVPRLPKF